MLTCRRYRSGPARVVTGGRVGPVNGAQNSSLGTMREYDRSPRRTRDRRARRRTPWILPGPHSPDGVPATRSRRKRFDAIVVGIVADLESRWPAELSDVEFGVEEAPWVDDDWRPEQVPLATLVYRTSRRPPRIVVYRLPIRTRSARAGGAAVEPDLVRAAIVLQVAELLGRSPDEVDPRPVSDADGDLTYSRG
jgi:hypothetical protein